ncbi:MAG: hypothetical protein ACON37_03000 [Candidatus Puniceispirillaceae bacterium]
MTQVIEEFANIAAGIVGGVIKSIPEPGTQPYWIMLGTLLALLALLMIWLLLRLRRARLARQADAAFAPEVTFDDISAQAAADQQASADPDIGKDAPLAPSPSTADRNEAASSVAGPVADPESTPASGFRFFKKKTKSAAQTTSQTAARSADDIDDDIYLLGLEQEMLATRQLYLDGLITKEVYVTETRALYDKAQSRMT